MPQYDLEYSPFGLGTQHRHTFEAPDRQAALEMVSRFVAASHAAEGQFVAIDDAVGMVTVGAGYWRRRGTFSLVERTG